jgi:hypothetical protein
MEDKYLVLKEEHQQLKLKCNDQKETIKRYVQLDTRECITSHRSPELSRGQRFSIYLYFDNFIKRSEKIKRSERMRRLGMR